jgi:hypothetical protein
LITNGWSTIDRQVRSALAVAEVLERELDGWMPPPVPKELHAERSDG